MSGIASGTAMITYTVDTSYATIKVTVDSMPNVYVASGGGSRCVNGAALPIRLNGSQLGVTYSIYLLDTTSWVIVAYGYGTGAALEVGAVTAAGMYEVVAFRGGCAVGMDGWMTVTVNPLPPLISGPSTVCEGATVTLSDSLPGGTWNSKYPSMATVTDSTGIVTGVSPGVDLISYTSPAGCVRGMGLAVAAMPVPVITYDEPDNTLYAPAGCTSYQWYDSSRGMIPDATSPSIAALYTDYYYVSVTGSNGCERTSAPFYFNVRELRVNGAARDGSVKLFPNPACNKIKITLTSGAPINSVTLITSAGQVVFTGGYYGENKVSVDISKLPEGLYFARINGLTTVQFLKGQQ